MFHKSSSSSVVLLLASIIILTFILSSSSSSSSSFAEAQQKTQTPNISQSVSESLSEPRTKTQSNTISLAVPQPPPIIRLVSSLAVPALCMMSSDQVSTSSRACRNVIFNVTYDGFMFQSQLLELVVRNQVLKPIPCSRPCPYGFPSLFETFKHSTGIISNVTHLTIVMPIMPVLDPAGQVEMTFDWTSRPVTLRSIAPQNARSSVFITAVTNVVASNSVLTTAQRMSGVLCYLASLAGSNPAVYDVQILSILGTSECVHPGVRLTAAPGLRVLRPTVFGTLDENEIMRGMWHNLVMALIIVVLHLFGTSIARMRAVTWVRAMSRTWFPALSYQIACCLLPGMVSSAILVSAAYTKSAEPDAALQVIAIIIYPVAACLAFLPTIFRNRIFKATTRRHDIASYEFPPIVRRLLAQTSWGPDEEATSWSMPFAACKSGATQWASLSLIYTLGHVINFSIIPPNPAGCGGQAGAGIAWSVLYSLLLIKFRPYRSSADTALSAVSGLTVVAPMGFIIARATSLDDTDAGENGVTLLAMCHFVASFRAVIAIGSFLIERRFLRPIVWEDTISTLAEHDASTLPGGRSEAEEKSRKSNDANANEAQEAQDADILQELLVKQEQHRHELKQEAEKGKNMTDEERRTYLFFGVPEPVGMNALEEAADQLGGGGRKKGSALLGKNSAMNREAQDEALTKEAGATTMTRLIRNEGVMPPSLKNRMEKEYTLL